MSAILAIDPGPERSAWLVYDTEHDVVRSFAIVDDNVLLDQARCGFPGVGSVVIERIESYGMPVGREVFDTVWFTGRLAEACRPLPVHLLERRYVKLHLCADSRARDPNVRQALIDRFGGPEATRKGGLLQGISRDVWSALALAVTWSDWFGGTR